MMNPKFIPLSKLSRTTFAKVVIIHIYLGRDKRMITETHSFAKPQKQQEEKSM